jgi:hypothetical protein
MESTLSLLKLLRCSYPIRPANLKFPSLLALVVDTHSTCRKFLVGTRILRRFPKSQVNHGFGRDVHQYAQNTLFRFLDFWHFDCFFEHNEIQNLWFPSYVLSLVIHTFLEKLSDVPAIGPDSLSCQKSCIKFSTLYFSSSISVERILK